MFSKPYNPQQQQDLLTLQEGLPSGSGIAIMASSIAFTKTIDFSFFSSG